MMIGRGKVLAARLVLGLMCSVWVAQAQRPTDFSKFEIKTTQVGDNVYQMESPVSGNTATFVGSDGVLLVDSQYAPMHDRIVAAVKKLSDQPIRFLINTHSHNDHTEGNELMAKAGVVIIAHENVRSLLSTGRAAGPGRRAILPSPPGALPTLTYTDSLSLHFNGDEVYVFHPEVAHTDGDSVVYIRRANVIHTGDIVNSRRFPNITVTSGMIAAMERMLKIANPDTKFIAGHGPISTFQDIQAYHQMLVTVRDRILSGIRAGQTMEQVVASNPTADFNDSYKEGRTAEAFVKEIYRDLAKN